LDEFTCLLYGQNHKSSMDGLRAKPLRKIVGEDEKFTSKLKVDLARLPPCHPALKPHIQQVNHRLALYKRADESILGKRNPQDDGQGWIRTKDGLLELGWSCSAALPNSLVDLLDTGGRGTRGGGGKRGRTSSISVKAMVNDDTYRMKPMGG